MSCMHMYVIYMHTYFIYIIVASAYLTAYCAITQPLQLPSKIGRGARIWVSLDTRVKEVS